MRIQVPFFRPDIGAAEVEEVVAALRSGWLTTGPRVQRFEAEFAAAVGSRHAVAVNSCTAALHLAVEALGLGAGQGVLVPTMTFAATAEVVRYVGAIPILVDCDPVTANLDLQSAQERIAGVRARTPGPAANATEVVGLMPVHVGGLMMDMDEVARFANRHGLWIVEDAAHAFPAAWRPAPDVPFRRCGEATATATCFSFYANKTITTGEGGMAVTSETALADRMRLMSLHGLSRDAWGRYTTGGTWDYRILAPGYKYNLTDVAAAIGLQQLRRAEAMRQAREQIAHRYLSAFAEVEEIALPPPGDNRVHAWHLFPIRLRTARLSIDRGQFIDELKRLGVACAVHWRPLHLHPYYQDTFGYRSTDCPHATALFDRLVSLPLFPALSEVEILHVIDAVKKTAARFRIIARRRTASGDGQGVLR